MKPVTRISATIQARERLEASAGARPRRWAQIYPVGPQWFGAVMGTGILATCVQRLAVFVPGLHWVALALLMLAWGVLAVVAAAFTLDAVRCPDRFRTGLSDLNTVPFYGSVAMGLLAVGAATHAVSDTHLPVAAAAAAWALWGVGTLLGVVTAVGFPVRLLITSPVDRGVPTPVWVLPVVPPMVSAAGGASLAATLPPGVGVSALLVGCAGLFVLTLVLGAGVLVSAYGHVLRGGSVPLPISPSFWIPVGVAGQSTAAANFLLPSAEHALSSSAYTVLHTAGVAYSAVALSLGTVAAAVALRITLHALRRGMTFSLGWWSFTFPVGTMSLGLSAFGTTLAAPWLHVAATVVCACLCATVSLCLVLSTRLWSTGRA